MKRICSLLLSFLIISGLCSCGGNADNIKMKDVASDIYSDGDIDAAIQTIIKEFDKEWKGCELTEIYYGGDEISAEHQDWADRNDADEVIVLLSSFDVGASGGDSSFNPNSTYDDFMWILVRDAEGKWKHVDHGY